MADLLEFQAPAALVPPGASPLLGAILLAIDVALTAGELTDWSARHAHLQPLLPATEREIAVAARLVRLAVLEITALRSLPALAAWWTAHQLDIRGLDPAGRASVVAAKDAAKARLPANH